MTADIGNYSLSAAILLAAGVLLVSLAAVRFGSQSWNRAARRGMLALAGVLTVASGALLTALLQSDFRLDYVVHYTERALPVGYKVAAFWAGQQGSLLLWAWLLAVMACVLGYYDRKRQGPEHAVALGVLAVVIGFFAVLMLFANSENVKTKANPFALTPKVLDEDGKELTPEVVEDGEGLNPLLQNPAMIAHPPILFAGYAGFTIPLALLIGALITGRLDKRWMEQARPWAMAAWSLLGAGIILGAQWAYVELGWGGYWGWDPVENASLLPWLTGTALVHCMVGQRQQGMFKRWTAVMAALTFILCILATYITRSGAISSVHAFPKSLIGDFFLFFMLVSTAVVIGLLAWRWKALKSERQMDGLLTREGMFMSANVLLVLMMLITCVMTFWPVISREISNSPFLQKLVLRLTRRMIDGPQTIVAERYNRMILPLGLALVALMALGPVLSYGAMSLAKVARMMAIPLAVGIAVLGTLAAMGIRGTWALSAGTVCAAVIASILADWGRILIGGMSLLGANRRRFGAHVVHLGVTLMVVGIAGSSLFNTKEFVQFSAGQSKKVGRYDLKLESVEEVKGPNFRAVEATVVVSEGGQVVETLRPQHRFYERPPQENAEIAFRWTLREDLYLTLGGWDEHGLATLQVVVNPLLSWIWIGGIVMGLGAIVCLLPKPRGAEQEEVMQADAPLRAFPVKVPPIRARRVS